ncbi:MAG: dTMP kinase [Ahniella sp.]|nr:dTMP kinase [Ahniella sp.]
MPASRHDTRPPPGLLLVIDGLDGAGKSTLIAGLARHLTQREVVLSREPTYGPYGRQLRDSAASGRLSAEREIELFVQDRTEHVRELIAPALARGAIVILDRYYYSSVAYQADYGSPESILAQFTGFAPKPDLALILDLPVAVAIGRIHARGAGQNDFEHTDTLSRCRDRFAWVLANCPETRRLDADRPPAAVLAEALGQIVLCCVARAKACQPDPSDQACELAWLLDRAASG